MCENVGIGSYLALTGRDPQIPEKLACDLIYIHLERSTLGPWGTPPPRPPQVNYTHTGEPQPAHAYTHGLMDWWR